MSFIVFFFSISDETFLKTHDITPEKMIKLFVRVKERIVPTKCSHKTTPAMIEITLRKDNPSSAKWNRLEPIEYSEFQSSKTNTILSTSPSTHMSNVQSSFSNGQTSNGKLELNHLAGHFQCQRTDHFQFSAIPLPPPLPRIAAVRQVRCNGLEFSSQWSCDHLFSQINFRHRRLLRLRSRRKTTNREHSRRVRPSVSLVFIIQRILVL